MSFPETITLTPGEVKTQTATQKCPLGTRGVTSDGRSFRYAKAGAAITKSIVVQATNTAGTGINALGFNNTTGALTAAATTFTTTWRYFTILTSWQGNATALVKDIYAGGYVVDTLAGGLSLLKGNDGMTASSTEQGNFYLDDDDTLPASITGTDYPVMIVKNPYHNVVIASAVGAGSGVTLGVAPRSVTAAYYFWLQTWGPCAILLMGTNVPGNPMYHSTETVTSAGVPSSDAVQDSAYLGDCISTAATTKYGVAMLRMAP